MSERGPIFDFEVLESSKSREKGPYLHTPEIGPDEKCGAKVEITTSLEPGNRAKTYATVSCDKCTIFDNLSAIGRDLEIAQRTVFDEVKELIKNECPLWKIKQMEGSAPDWFLPKELR